MTLRLVLVGLVAALGLTIPQWSNPTNRVGSPQTAGTFEVKERNKQASARVGRTQVRDSRFFPSAAATASKKYQPVGFGSGVIRPNTKAHGNFWRLPSGTRPAQVASLPVAKIKDIKAIQVSHEPIQLAGELDRGLAYDLNRNSEGLVGVVLQGPPARLKPAKPVYVPLDVVADLYGGLAMALNRQAEGTGVLPYPKEMLRNEFRLVRQPLAGLDTFAAIAKVVESAPLTPSEPAPVVAGAEVLPSEGKALILPAALAIVTANLEGELASLGRQVRQAGDMAGDLRTRVLERLAAGVKPKVMVVADVEKPAAVEFATLPDDVFAPVAPAPVVAEAPAPVVVEAPAPSVAVVNAEPAPLPNLPDDVFAPVVLTAKQIAAEEPAPEAPAVLEEVAAKPATDHAPEVVIAPVSKPDEAATALEKVASPERVEKRSDSPSHLTKAVSLTRDAAVAWMKLLSEPAVVTLAR